MYGSTRKRLMDAKMEEGILYDEYMTHTEAKEFLRELEVRRAKNALKDLEGISVLDLVGGIGGGGESSNTGMKRSMALKDDVKSKDGPGVKGRLVAETRVVPSETMVARETASASAKKRAPVKERVGVKRQLVKGKEMATKKATKLEVKKEAKEAKEEEGNVVDLIRRSQRINSERCSTLDSDYEDSDI